LLTRFRLRRGQLSGAPFGEAILQSADVKTAGAKQATASNESTQYSPRQYATIFSRGIEFGKSCLQRIKRDIYRSWQNVPIRIHPEDARLKL
jgi:hypothetical protein